MRNTFIKLSTVYGQIIRINVDHIASYYQSGNITEINVVGGGPISTELPADEIDQMLLELYFMVKK